MHEIIKKPIEKQIEDAFQGKWHSFETEPPPAEAGGFMRRLKPTKALPHQNCRSS